MGVECNAASFSKVGTDDKESLRLVTLNYKTTVGCDILIYSSCEKIVLL